MRYLIISLLLLSQAGCLIIEPFDLDDGCDGCGPVLLGPTVFGGTAAPPPASGPIIPAAAAVPTQTSEPPR